MPMALARRRIALQGIDSFWGGKVTSMCIVAFKDINKALRNMV
jgi:hypothetical protein